VGAIEFFTSESKILILYVYMPFLYASNKDVCIQETLDAISMIDLICEDHPHHKILIGGDFNSELAVGSAFYDYWHDFMERKKL
jgi:hypothetical protein